jgi:hypothetical protein
VGGGELGPDLSALAAIGAVAQLGAKHFDEFVDRRNRHDPFERLRWGSRPPRRETGGSRVQVAGFQMMTFFAGSSPGAGATLP